MSNLVMWNLVVGFLAPTVIALLQQPRFTEPVRAMITVAVCIVGGFGTAYFNDQFKVEDIVGSVLVVAVAAITFYKGFWKPTNVAPKLEAATSPKNERGETSLGLVIGVLLVIILVVVLVRLL